MTAAGKLLRQAMDLGDEPDISLVHAAYKAAGIIDPKNPDPIQGKAVKGLQNMHVGQLTGSKESPFLSSTSKTPTPSSRSKTTRS